MHRADRWHTLPYRSAHVPSSFHEEAPTTQYALSEGTRWVGVGLGRSNLRPDFRTNFRFLQHVSIDERTTVRRGMEGRFARLDDDFTVSDLFVFVTLRLFFCKNLFLQKYKSLFVFFFGFSEITVPTTNLLDRAKFANRVPFPPHGYSPCSTAGQGAARYCTVGPHIDR